MCVGGGFQCSGDKRGERCQLRENVKTMIGRQKNVGGKNELKKKFKKLITTVDNKNDYS